MNVALPSIQQGLQAGESAVEWIVAGYAISTAVLLVTGGRLGDQFGRRRVFAIGMAVFVLTSAACALAPDPAILVAGRVLQGVGAALMAPNILSILGVVYSGPARVRAISVYGMVMGLAAVSGQLIGGVLIRSDLGGLGWRAIFWINVPFGVAALLACRRLVPESRADQGSRFDLTGVALITACLVAVVLPLVDGRQAGWPAWSWIALGSAVPLAIVFAAHRPAGRQLDRGGRHRRAVLRRPRPELRPGLRAQRAPNGRPPPGGGRADQADAGASVDRVTGNRLDVFGRDCIDRMEVNIRPRQ